MIIETLPGKNLFGHFPMILPDSGPADFDYQSFFDSQNVRETRKNPVDFGKLGEFWEIWNNLGNFENLGTVLGTIEIFGGKFGKFGGSFWKIGTMGKFGRILGKFWKLGNFWGIWGQFRENLGNRENLGEFWEIWGIVGKLQGVLLDNKGITNKIRRAKRAGKFVGCFYWETGGKQTKYGARSAPENF